MHAELSPDSWQQQALYWQPSVPCVTASQPGLSQSVSAGAVYKYDLSLPPNDMYKLVEEMRARMKHLPVTVVGYGHMGDSNLHLNISAGTCLPYHTCQS